MSYLKWYPGFGETVIFNRLAAPMRRFLSDASSECPEFLSEYVVPVLQSSDPEARFLSDLSIAVAALEFEEAGLGSYEQNLGDLGHLGKSFFKKLGKTLKKSLNPIRAIKGAAAFTKREVKKEVKILKKVEKTVVKGVEKVARKYGGIILTVVGAVLAPFTGGLSMAAATILIAAQKAYQAHAQAQYAKRMGRKEAAAMQRDADAQNAQVQAQVDQFYSQNQDWFVKQLGVTPDKWGRLTLDQKIGLINAGSSGQVPSSAPPSSAPATVTAPPSGGPTYQPSLPPPTQTQTDSSAQSYMPQPSYAPQSSYPPQLQPSMPQMPSGSGTQDWGFTPGGMSPPGPGGAVPQGQGPQVSQASMFGDGSGMMMPAALVAAAMIFSQKGGAGGSRKRRNPGRRRRW